MQFFFHRVYEMADLVATTIENDNTVFEELEWDSPEICRCLTRFSKISLLGHYCFATIRLNNIRAYRKEPESFDEDHVRSTEAALGLYGIPFIPFQEFLCRTFSQEEIDDPDSGSQVIARIKDPLDVTGAMVAAAGTGRKILLDRREGEYVITQRPDPDIYDALHLWVSTQEDQTFLPLWEKMTDEVVHLLFSNRSFLLTFNSALAAFRKHRGDMPSPRCHIPQWVKRAAYFRENGKCALCRKDLSGLLFADPKQHYDHIVPLKGLGANDPCNIQLLCTGCNLAKGGSSVRTSSMYEPWWH